MASKKQEQAEAIERLRQCVQKGDTLYTLLRRASPSGMSRTIQVVSIKDNEPAWLGYNVALALGLPYDRINEGVKVRGAGMDMGFALVYDLARVLFDDGYALNQRWL